MGLGLCWAGLKLGAKVGVGIRVGIRYNDGLWVIVGVKVGV